MFGIAWGIISITLMVAAGEGLRVGQKKVQEGFGKDIMLVLCGAHQHASRWDAGRTRGALAHSGCLYGESGSDGL